MNILNISIYNYIVLWNDKWNDAIPQPNHTHIMWKIRRARYTNASSIAKKCLLAYKLRSSCPSPLSHPSSTWAREWDPGNRHGRG